MVKASPSTVIQQANRYSGCKPNLLWLTIFILCNFPFQQEAEADSSTPVSTYANLGMDEFDSSGGSPADGASWLQVWVRPTAVLNPVLPAALAPLLAPGGGVRAVRRALLQCDAAATTQLPRSTAAPPTCTGTGAEEGRDQ